MQRTSGLCPPRKLDLVSRLTSSAANESSAVLKRIGSANESSAFLKVIVFSCRSRIRRQAATGSWTRSRQWETQRTLFNSARATVCPPAKVNGVWPSNDAWLRAAL